MIKRELAIFLVVGATTVLVDFVTYRSLIGFEVMIVDMAKAIGFFGWNHIFLLCQSFLDLCPQTACSG